MNLQICIPNFPAPQLIHLFFLVQEEHKFTQLWQSIKSPGFAYFYVFKIGCMLSKVCKLRIGTCDSRR